MSPRGSLWLPTTPKHWSIVRAKHLFLHMSRAVRDGDRTITCFRDGTVTTRHSRRTDGFTESLKEIGYQGVRSGDLVIHTMDAFAGAIGVSDADGKATPVYCVCSPLPGVDAHYYGNLLREMARTGWIAALAKGVRERSCDFRWSDFASQKLPAPPIIEQKSIVRFVDRVGRRILQIITGRQHVADTLDEERRVMLRGAVTRGIDGDVQLRASGVPWIGDVPEHWEVRRLKQCARLVMGQSPPGHACSLLPGRPFLQGCAEFGDRHPVPEQSCERPNKVAPQGSILLSVRAPVGRLNRANTEYGIGRGLCAILPYPADLQTDFAYYQLEALKEHLLASATGSTYDAVSVSDIGNHVILLPPKAEQARIASYLDGATANFEASVSGVRREIELLTEYRTRLIADVVTGRLDVREAADGLPEPKEAGD